MGPALGSLDCKASDLPTRDPRTPAWLGQGEGKGGTRDPNPAPPGDDIACHTYTPLKSQIQFISQKGYGEE